MYKQNLTTTKTKLTRRILIILALLCIACISAPAGHATPKSDSVQAAAKIDAEIKNQLAQATYYSKQPSSTYNQWISVLGVLAAGFVGFFSAVVLAAKNAKNAKEQDIK